MSPRLGTAILLTTALFGRNAAYGAPNDDRVHVDLIPKNFVAAIVFNPQGIVKSPTAARLPLDDFLKSLRDESKFDPMKLDRVVVLAEPFPGGNVLFVPALMIRFVEDADPEKVFEEILGACEKKTTGGKEYVCSSTQKIGKVPICGHCIDKRNYLFAVTLTMDRMLSQIHEKGMLAERLRETKVEADVFILLTPEPIRKELNQIIKENANVPEKWAPAAKLPDQLNLLTIKVNLDAPTLIDAKAETIDRDSAKVLKQLLTDALEAVKPSSNEVVKDGLSQAPAKVRDFFAPILDSVEKNTTIEQDDKNVIVRVPRPKAFDQPKK